MRYLYLHGFASGPQSRKGTALQRALAPQGIELQLLDLNVPSFQELSPVRALQVVDEAAGPEGPLTLLGSSMGGWLSAIWAERHPERVERLVLLCPGFDLVSRWPELVGPELMVEWERRGRLPVKDGAGRTVRLHWRFVEDARTLPPWPGVRCPTLVIHGSRDETVPLWSSVRWVEAQSQARLIVLDDDHGLEASLERIGTEVLDFLQAP